MKNVIYWLWIIVIVVALAALVHFVTGTAPHGPGSTASSTENGAPVTFYCGSGNTLTATFGANRVALALSDGRSFTLMQGMSGSGVRYTLASSTTNPALEFWNEGDNAFLNEGTTTTYADCTAAQVSASGNGDRTYTDQSGTFSFAVPSGFQIAGSAAGYSLDWAAQATTSGRVLAKVVVPGSYMPGTNFADARFTVGASSDPSALATCLDAKAGPVDSAKAVTIGGLPFTRLTESDAGAGNRYDTTSYRIVRDGTCYAVEYTIHYGAFENFPKGAVTRFDEPAIAATLDAMAQSFKFLQ